MTERTKFILWGSAGHAKVLASLIELRAARVMALFENIPKATSAQLRVPLHVEEEGSLSRIKEQSG